MQYSNDKQPPEIKIEPPLRSDKTDLNEFNSLQWLLKKQRKNVISPRNAGEPNIVIPKGMKYDYEFDDIVPLTDHELKVDKLKEQLIEILHHSKKREEHNELFPIDYEHPESNYESSNDSGEYTDYTEEEAELENENEIDEDSETPTVNYQVNGPSYAEMSPVGELPAKVKKESSIVSVSKMPGIMLQPRRVINNISGKNVKTDDTK